jgi:hypothetical protein
MVLELLLHYCFYCCLRLICWLLFYEISTQRVRVDVCSVRESDARLAAIGMKFVICDLNQNFVVIALSWL